MESSSKLGDVYFMNFVLKENPEVGNNEEIHFKSTSEIKCLSGLQREGRIPSTTTEIGPRYCIFMFIICTLNVLGHKNMVTLHND